MTIAPLFIHRSGGDMPLTALLYCNDLAETERHYRDVLGFTVAGSAESTLTVRLGDCSLVFTQENPWGGPAACSATFYLVIEQVDRYYDAVKERATIAWPLQDMPYGSREFGVRDCNGYHLGFSQAQG
ncbi:MULTISPECIES: glyoxalase/bleomycin resistance/extradiol dioxygenase family protein [unclassified Pseudomonas]|uniref:VOC family protein n=1 Tax=unclassified Pseudomonas TaxID=196821 RepID=UPI0021143385|nr:MULTISPECIES: VOC family protein [unclassified Pseudomonas]